MVFVWKAQRKGETVDQFIAREVKENGGGLACNRVKKSQWRLNPDWPQDKKHRNKWRWDRVNKKLWVDHSLKDKSEQMASLFEVVRSTSETKERKIDALLEVEALKKEK